MAEVAGIKGTWCYLKAYNKMLRRIVRQMERNDLTGLMETYRHLGNLAIVAGNHDPTVQARIIKTMGGIKTFT